VNRRRALAALLAGLGLAASSAVRAEPFSRLRELRRRLTDDDRDLRGRDGTSLDGAVQRWRERIGGRVLSAETRREEDRSIHHIRIITDQGRVRRLRIDADTGRVIEPRRR
jgi:uncharacterized membrane protein YkoI